MRDRNGNPVVIKTLQGQVAAAYTFQPRAATRALELLGKHVGLFTNRLEVNVREEPLLPDFTREDLIVRLIETAPPALLTEVEQRLQAYSKPALPAPHNGKGNGHGA